MKVLMLNYEFPPLGGGAAPVTKFLAEELVTLNHEVDVVTMLYKGLKRQETLNGVNIYRVGSVRQKQASCNTFEMFSYCLSSLRTLPKLFKMKKYDINHTHFIIPTGFVSKLKRKKVPYIITSHGSDVPGYNPDRFAPQHILLQPIWKGIIDKARCLTSPTYFLKNLILQSLRDKAEFQQKIVVVPNGIKIEDYNFDPEKKEDKILVVTRLFERKGVQFVIEAMKGIKDYELVICGEGPYKEKLEEQIKKSSAINIHLLGYVDYKRLKHEYETASIFILSSSAENFPVVLLEAMASGCAVVTSNTTGCPEVVGETALLAPPMDSNALRKALLKLIDNGNLIRDLGTKARKRVEENFTWQNVAKQYEEIYRSYV